MVDLFLKGGFLMYPILLGSILVVAILMEKLIRFRKILNELNTPLEEILTNNVVPEILVPIVEGLKINCDKKLARSYSAYFFEKRRNFYGSRQTERWIWDYSSVSSMRCGWPRSRPSVL